VTSGGAPASTSTPAAVSPIASIPPNLKRSYRGIFIAAAALLVAGGVAYSQLGGRSETAGAPLAAPERAAGTAVPAPQVTEVAAAKAAETAAPAKTVDATKPAASAEGAEAAEASSAGRAPSRWRPRAAPAPRPKTKPSSGGGPRKSEEPDVGY
jgi:hypothetical protein